MTTLMPRGYGGFPSYQFSPPNQFHNRHFNRRYPRQGVSFAPHYPTQRLYQPPFNPVERNVAPYANQYRQSGLGTELVMLFNDLDAQYRQKQYLRQLEKMQRNYWTQQANNIPPPLYYSPGTVYQYEKETQYIPYPVYIGPGGRSIGTSGYLGNIPRSNMTMGLRSGGMNLAPKIRMIFIPTGQSFSQQPYIGSLAMPPFLYNRISQPFCSFPLPPPLPQLGLLPLTPAIQQMVVQRYSNPVAVLPFTPNWQAPQMIMPAYPPIPQQQQPYILPPPPQVYFPPVPISALPPAPQAYIAPPVPQAYILPPAPQPYIPPPAPPIPVPTLPPIPEMYIPPPPIIPLPDANVNASIPQYFYNGYPSICRACPPAPPPLNVPVTGHCWVQHCAACHHVPNLISNPNIRPAGGRMTPLLRQPTVPQYVPEATRQQYFYADAPVMTRPWLRKTPPIPPGAIIISDEIYAKNAPAPQYNYPQRQHRQRERGSRHKYRSTTVASKPNPTANDTPIKNNRSISPRRIKTTDVNPNRNQRTVEMKNPVLASPSSASSSEYQKGRLQPSEPKQNPIPPSLTREARNVNLKYKYQPEELPTVYLLNRFLASTSETSTLSSNVETLSNPSSRLIKQRDPILSSPSFSSSSTSITNDLISKKDDKKPPRPPSRSKQFKEKLIIIREFSTSSPSTLSTISSDLAFSIINKDDDSISTTSTLKTDCSNDDDFPRRNLF